jgi:8-oxo-dGTP diphosphatase
MAATRIAGVILYRDGKVLLQHRDDDPAIISPGKWAIFGGHVEEREDPEEAARREIAEELGLRLEGDLQFVLHTVSEERERFFFAAPLTVELDELILNEGQGMALLGPDVWDDYPIVPLHRRILEEFSERATDQTR